MVNILWEYNYNYVHIIVYSHKYCLPYQNKNFFSLEHYLFSNKAPRFWSEPKISSNEEKDAVYEQMANSLDLLYREVLTKGCDISAFFTHTYSQ